MPVLSADVLKGPRSSSMTVCHAPATATPAQTDIFHVPIHGFLDGSDVPGFPRLDGAGGGLPPWRLRVASPRGECPPVVTLSSRAGLARPPLALTLRERGEGGRVRPAHCHTIGRPASQTMNDETVVLEEGLDSNLFLTRLTLQSHIYLFILRALVADQKRRRCSQHLVAESPSQHTSYCDPTGRRESTRRYQ